MLPRLPTYFLTMVCLGSAAYSQTRPSPTVTDGAALPNDEVVTLNEFHVDASKRLDAYIANEATSGTRTDAKILEIPYNVQVVTNQFMEDFQVFDENNYRPLQYIANYAPDNGGFLRGFAPVVMRDGFSRAGPSAIANTAEIEVISGPQSTLYGYTSPGGIINYVSKRPSLTESYLFTSSVGAYGFNRDEFQATGPLGSKKLYYLLTASYIYNRENMRYYYSNVALYDLALTYKASENTSVTLYWEAQSQAQNGGTAIPNLLVGSKQSGTNPLNRTGGINDGPDMALAGFNQYGPDQRITRGFYDGNLLIEHRFNDHWSGRLSIQGYDKTFNDHRWTSSLSYIPETGRLNSRQPAFQEQFIETYAVRSDLLGKYHTNWADHSLLFALDYTRDRYQNQQFQLPTAAAAAIPDSQQFLNPNNPDWTAWSNYLLLNREASYDTRNITYEGVTASHRMYLLGGKLITLIGARGDQVSSRVDNVLAVSGHGNGSEDAFSYSFGANYKIFDDKLVAYGNYSTSFNPSTTVDNGTDQVQKSTRGAGAEFGFKGTFDEGKIGYTISNFRIIQNNMPITNPDYTTALAGSGTPQYLGEGQEVAKGVEVVISGRVTDNLTLLANAGLLDIKTTESPGNPAIFGDSVVNIPNKTASGAARYSFAKGFLQGLRIGTSVTYTGRRYTNLGTATALRRWIAPVQLFNAFATYEWREGKWTHSVNLNLENLFNKYYLNGAGKLGDGSNFRVTYRLGY